MTEANSSIIVMEKNREYDGESTRSKTDQCFLVLNDTLKSISIAIMSPPYKVCQQLFLSFFNAFFSTYLHIGSINTITNYQGQYKKIFLVFCDKANIDLAFSYDTSQFSTFSLQQSMDSQEISYDFLSICGCYERGFSNLEFSSTDHV